MLPRGWQERASIPPIQQPFTKKQGKPSHMAVILSFCEESPGWTVFYEILRSHALPRGWQKWRIGSYSHNPVILSFCEESPDWTLLYEILRSHTLPQGWQKWRIGSYSQNPVILSFCEESPGWTVLYEILRSVLKRADGLLLPRSATLAKSPCMWRAACWPCFVLRTTIPWRGVLL